jgi:hypothetical protein
MQSEEGKSDLQRNQNLPIRNESEHSGHCFWAECSDKGLSAQYLRPKIRAIYHLTMKQHAANALIGGTKHLAERQEIHPAEYLLLEGVSSSRAAFRPYLALSIWMETPRHERLRRGLERDEEAARTQWEEWMAREDEYIERNTQNKRLTW